MYFYMKVRIFLPTNFDSHERDKYKSREAIETDYIILASTNVD